jgi:hypothetical protein
MTNDQCSSLVVRRWSSGRWSSGQNYHKQTKTTKIVAGQLPLYHSHGGPMQLMYNLAAVAFNPDK